MILDQLIVAFSEQGADKLIEKINKIGERIVHTVKKSKELESVLGSKYNVNIEKEQVKIQREKARLDKDRIRLDEQYAKSKHSRAREDIRLKKEKIKLEEQEEKIAHSRQKREKSNKEIQSKEFNAKIKREAKLKQEAQKAHDDRRKKQISYDKMFGIGGDLDNKQQKIYSGVAREDIRLKKEKIKLEQMAQKAHDDRRKKQISYDKMFGIDGDLDNKQQKIYSGVAREDIRLKKEKIKLEQMAQKAHDDRRKKEISYDKLFGIGGDLDNKQQKSHSGVAREDIRLKKEKIKLEEQEEKIAHSRQKREKSNKETQSKEFNARIKREAKLKQEAQKAHDDRRKKEISYDKLFGIGGDLDNKQQKIYSGVDAKSKTIETSGGIGKISAVIGTTALAFGAMASMAKKAYSFWSSTAKENILHIGKYSQTGLSDSQAEGFDMAIRSKGGNMGEGLAYASGIQGQLGLMKYGDTSLVEKAGMFGIGGIGTHSSTKDVLRALSAKYQGSDEATRQAMAQTFGWSSAMQEAMESGNIDSMDGKPLTMTQERQELLKKEIEAENNRREILENIADSLNPLSEAIQSLTDFLKGMLGDKKKREELVSEGDVDALNYTNKLKPFGEGGFFDTLESLQKVQQQQDYKDLMSGQIKVSASKMGYSMMTQEELEESQKKWDNLAWYEKFGRWSLGGMRPHAVENNNSTIGDAISNSNNTTTINNNNIYNQNENSILTGDGDVVDLINIDETSSLIN